VYDELQNSDGSPAYAKLMGRLSATGTAGFIIASFTASLLAHCGYNFILWLSAISILLSVAMLAILPESKKTEQIDTLSHVTRIKDGVQTVIHKPKIFFLVAFMSIVAGLGAVDEYFNLFFREKGFSNAAIAFWIAVVYIFGAVGGLFAHKLEGKRLPARTSLFLWAALLFLTSIAPMMLAPFLLGVYTMFFSGVNVLFNAYLQKEIGDKTRATTTSVGGFTAELFAILSFLIVSFGASRVGYAFSFRLVAGTVVLSAILLALYSRKHALSL
jgi:MFS family permease